MSMKLYMGLFFGLLATLIINAGVTQVAPGLAIWSWTPVWAAYALWQYLLRRESIRVIRSDEFDKEYRTLLEREGQK